MIKEAVKRLADLAWPALVEARAVLAPLFGAVGRVHAKAMTIPGWISGDDARAMAQASLSLEGDPVIVEIGTFMGRSTALLAGARRLRGGGRVYCVDPFDCSGDEHSIPFYLDELNASKQSSLERAFRKNISRHGLEKWVEVRKDSSENVARSWRLPIDLLLLDADHSPQGARAIFDAWIPFLKPGGTVMLPNTKDRVHQPGHDGNRRLVVEELRAPRFLRVRTIDELTLAERAP